MKKISNTFIISLASIGVLIVSNNELYAQKEKSNSVVAIGIGLGHGMEVPFSSAVKTFDYSRSPVLYFSYDYCIADNISLGLVYTFQSHSLNYTKYPYYTSSGGTSGTWTDKATRQNFAIKPLYHFGDNKVIDCYAGLLLGYNSWGITRGKTNYVSKDLSNLKSGVNALVVVGSRYILDSGITINIEIAYGVPQSQYYLTLGAGYKF